MDKLPFLKISDKIKTKSKIFEKDNERKEKKEIKLKKYVDELYSEEFFMKYFK